MCEGEDTMALTKEEEKALFRFNIIFPLQNLSGKDGSLSAKIREICSREYRIPHSKKTTISPGTVWKWLRAYQKTGTIDSLAPAHRSDRGRRRSISGETEDALLQRWKANPEKPLTTIVKEMERDGVFGPEDRAGMATIYTIINREKNGWDPKQQDRRAYRATSINDMWQSDALHGPMAVMPDGSRRTAILFVCIDNKSRLVCHAAWYGDESADSYLDCLWQAFRLRGLPKTVFVDNGASFRDDRLRLGCAQLGVHLIFARPYSPASKGVVERWNRTVRQQFLSMLPREPLTVTELNIRFARWIDEYNHRPHMTLDGISPLQCYLGELKAIRPAPDNLPLYFRRQDTRLVNADRTIRFQGNLLEVPIGYAGRKIEIRWFGDDPLHTCEGFFNGASIGLLRPVDRTANYFARRSQGGVR
jgi:transposase InsO family protein